jgi:peptidyl-tRNA hydrolase, PTH1 family
MVPLKLIVGLGNPGAEYARTRHNAGFWWVDRLCERERIQLRTEKKFHGLAARISSGGHDVWLLAPQTYMNDSGRSVVALALFYKILPPEIMVVCDELDLPPGTVKLKQGGGHAGHNGIKDIAAHLTTGDFWRLRIGVGHPGERGGAVVNHVLNIARPEDQAAIDDAIARSLDLFPHMARGEFSGAMMKLHTKKKSEADDAKDEKKNRTANPGAGVNAAKEDKST